MPLRIKEDVLELLAPVGEYGEEGGVFGEEVFSVLVLLGEFAH